MNKIQEEKLYGILEYLEKRSKSERIEKSKVDIEEYEGKIFLTINYNFDKFTHSYEARRCIVIGIRGGITKSDAGQRIFTKTSNFDSVYSIGLRD